VNTKTKKNVDLIFETLIKIILENDSKILHKKKKEGFLTSKFFGGTEKPKKSPKSSPPEVKKKGIIFIR
jgi:hypothetical protein